VPSFGHAVVVVLENKSRDEVLGNHHARAFNAFAADGAVLSGYRGVTHPSLPNYLALASGSTHGISDDCTRCTVSGRSLADTLAARGRTWKTYAEGLPGAGFAGASSGLYVKRHDPLLYFRDVETRRRRLNRIVPLSRFADDLRARRLPTFSLVIPDLCHDMHDCSVATGDAWLGGFVGPLLRSPALGRGVVFVVFDEGTSDRGGGGHVPALVAGPLVRPGSNVVTPLDHYSLLRTVEQSLHLPFLARSRDAVPITGIWRDSRRKRS